MKIALESSLTVFHKIFSRASRVDRRLNGFPREEQKSGPSKPVSKRNSFSETSETELAKRERERVKGGNEI